MKKRILSILVICCMVLGLLPTTAFADNDSVARPRYRLCVNLPKEETIRPAF